MNITISVEKFSGYSQWWNDLLSVFANPGDYFEIHCWTKEHQALQLAEQFGEEACFGMPGLKIIHGTITDHFLRFLLDNERKHHNRFYNKLTPFYTLHIGENFSSQDYGTKIVLKCRSLKEKEKIKNLLIDNNMNLRIYNTEKQDIWRVI